MSILGIDLGTTNSLGALYIDGHIQLIPNALGSYLTPSVVNIDEAGEVSVGEVAREKLITDPENTVSSFKKNMGTNMKYTIRGREFTPQELSSFVLRSIINDAERYVADKEGVTIDEVVISVPAYFHDKQRVATQEAGALAGAKVHRIVNEPSAAALAVYSERKEQELILVFDFGGGTLDVSIVDCFANVVEIISVAGNNKLGGDDFNALIADYFLKKNNLTRKDITDAEYATLLKYSEIAKKQLTSDGQSTVSLYHNGENLTAEITNDILMEESSWIFDRIKEVLEKALKEAELTINEIGSVILAGGSSNMPIIQTFIKILFKNTPIFSGGGDEFIAKGVGFVAGIIERDEELKEMVMTDLCPFSLGVAVHNKGNASRPYMSTIIPRNNALPCSISDIFSTLRPDQKKIDLEILQGENMYADENEKLGQMEIKVPENTGHTQNVQVRFAYDINGVLVVDVTILSTGEKFSTVISQTMDQTELEKRVEYLNNLQLSEADEDKVITARLHSVYKSSDKQTQEQIRRMLVQYDMVKSSQESRSISRFRRMMLKSLDTFEKKNKAFDVFKLYEEYDNDDEE